METLVSLLKIIHPIELMKMLRKEYVRSRATRLNATHRSVGATFQLGAKLGVGYSRGIRNVI
jgi:hypothetical protein